MIAAGSCQLFVSRMIRSDKLDSKRLHMKRTYPSPSGASGDLGMKTGS